MKEEEFNLLIEAETPVLVDFFSTTCDPCKWLLPILAQLENHFKEKLRIVKINIEEADNLREKLIIRSVPTLVLYKNKKILWRLAGFDTAPRMIATIEEHLAAY